MVKIVFTVMLMKKRGNLTILLPLALSAIFTLLDIFVMKIITRHFSTNPKFVVLSFLELYLLSALTMLFMKKEEVAVRKI